MVTHTTTGGHGLRFPFNYGYIPSTLGQDGDPVDGLLLMDDATFVGCVVVARLIGVIEATQAEVGARRAERNDRLIAVPAQSPQQPDITQIRQITPTLLDEVEHFFIAYTSLEGKRFTPLRRSGPARARRRLAQGMRAFEHDQ